jgi:hypothetical protein
LRRRFSIVAVPAVAVAVSVVTVLTRLGAVSLRELASTPQGVTDGREWQLLTSAFVADRPAVPSVIGFTIVGLAALVLAGARTLWAAAVAGHLLATVVVYAALDAAQVTVSRPDYGTSAIIAAWIGVIACCLWRRGAARAAVGFCFVAALVAWFFRPQLDILDSEHAVALAVGIGVAVWLPRLRPVQLRVLLARRGLPLHDGLLRLGSARRSG